LDVGLEIGLFRTESNDDILFVSSNTIAARFSATSVKRGGKVWTSARNSTPAGSRLMRVIRSSMRTFQTAFSLSSENNPQADANGEIQVRRGNRLPGVPRHIFKLGADYASRKPGWRGSP